MNPIEALLYAGPLSDAVRKPDYLVCYSCGKFWNNDHGLYGPSSCPECDDYLVRLNPYANKELQKRVEKEEKPQRILPCPFCGSDGYKIIYDGLGIVVKCKDCFAQSGRYANSSIAEKYWNRRFDS